MNFYTHMLIGEAILVSTSTSSLTECKITFEVLRS
jgi:hypothetical protein